MDLGAYAQIPDLEGIAEANGIEIPRLRGYRLMKDEQLMTQEEIDELKRINQINVAKSLCEAYPFWSPDPQYWESSSRSDAIKKYFLTKDKEGMYVSIRWDRIHGWKRRVLKFAIKKSDQKIQRQYDIWNTYAGRSDVLYIHSRMGGDNWKCYDKKAELINQPWFLDRVDDHWDSTYCDFYARIKEETAENKAGKV